MKLFHYIFVLITVIVSHFVAGQQITVAEYFWDTDPGLGNGTVLLAEDGALDEAVEKLFTNTASFPTAGFHTFNIRVKGLENTWSNTFSYTVNVSNQSLISRDVKIVQAEYFWDTDPGIGLATPILALDGNLDEALEALFDASSTLPSAGFHTFNLRVRGLDNTWSNVFSHTVNIFNSTLISRDVKVIEAEYFWDTDPGQGLATTILALDGNLDEAVESLLDGSVPIPSIGLHKFNLRIKGQDGGWSPIFSYVINVNSPTLSSGDLSIIQAEYFWDTDPGAGNGNVILALDGNLDEAVENLFDGSLPSPSSGLHTFNLRVKGLDNTWSSIFSFAVNVYTPTLISRNINVVEAEYFWDTDPGVGNASPIFALDGNLNEAVEELFASTLTPTSIGVHLFNIRVKGVDNVWSTPFQYAVNVLDSNTYTTIDPIICDGSSYTVPSGDETYSVAGTYTDTLINANGFDSLITINLIVSPSTSVTINPTVCGTYVSPEGNNYSSSGTYIDTIPNFNGCDSIITINLTILPTTFSSVAVGACDSLVSPSGNYVWSSSGTYMDTIPNAAGCDSIITVNLTISTATTSSVDVVDCDDYFWSATGLTYTASGSYTATILNSIGCDSVITLNLTLNNSYTNTTTITTCNSYFWPTNGVTYTSSGIYSLSSTNVDGCDSTHVLNLTVNNSDISTSNVIACGSYLWAENGFTYSASGLYTVTYTNEAGCDSIIQLNLSLGQNTTTNLNVAACDDYFWSANGTTYSASGSYTTTITTLEGCDSIINLNLIINTSSSSTQNIVACDSYFWTADGNTYTTGGAYFATIPNVSGCDSLVTLNLTILNSSGSTQDVSACNSYLWPTNGMTYTSSGTYTEIFTNAVGCDSVVTLNLSLGNDYTNTDVVSSCDDYFWPATGVTYTADGFYTASFLTAEGCDSILNLDLTINTSSTASVTLTGCDLYTWPLNGNSYASSGIYFATIPNAAGCDSVVTLNLTIINSTSSSEIVSTCDSYFWPQTGITYTASGTYPTTVSNSIGCDSIITLFLTLDYGYNATDVITACQSYTWPLNGQTYTNSGTYSISGFTANGCDSTTFLDLTIVSNSATVQTASSCGPYNWALNGNTYTSSGSYTTTVLSSTGCDSTVTLNLTVNSNSSSTTNITACDSYFWSPSGNTYTSSGTYTTVIPNAAGCDSSMTLNLTINNGFSNTSSVGACGDYTWLVNGTTYTNSGTYTANFIGANGCDSSYILNLTIGSPTSSSSSITACDSYFWPVDGQTYTNSGTYSSTMTNSSGCDSLLTLNLTISGATSSSETITACNSYVWAATGLTYTNSGIYSTTLLSQAGCDSTVNLDLTVSSVNATAFQNDNILTSSNANGGTYEWINCATGAPIVGETGQEFIATVNGDYAVIITLNGCSDTSNCVTVNSADIDQHFLESISLFPNPSDGKFTIDLGEFKDHATITLRDARGRLLQVEDYVNIESIDMRVDYPNGVYFLEITSNNENAVLRVVIE